MRDVSTRLAAPECLSEVQGYSRSGRALPALQVYGDPHLMTSVWLRARPGVYSFGGGRGCTLKAGQVRPKSPIFVD